MVETYVRPYLDSSVYIAAIKGEVVKGVERGRIARQIMSEAQKGALRICASSMVAAEVAKAGDGKLALAPDGKTAMIDAFLAHDFIDLIELDMSLAADARQIIVDYGLRSADAVHVAAALRLEADILLRWDGKWTDGEYRGLPVRDPYWWGQETLEV